VSKKMEPQKRSVQTQAMATSVLFSFSSTGTRVLPQEPFHLRAALTSSQRSVKCILPKPVAFVRIGTVLQEYLNCLSACPSCR